MKSTLLLLAALGWTSVALADNPAPEAVPPVAAPKDAAPPAADASKAAKPKAPEGPDTWIFSGALQGSRETFSATLVADKSESQFEMKMGSGATCDGGKLKGDVGLVRLPEITCSDNRPMRALFVPQANNILKVFGHVGDERFMAEAHLLGTETPPPAKQTAQPKGPLGLPPNGPPPKGPPGAAPPDAPKAPGRR